MKFIIKSLILPLIIFSTESHSAPAVDVNEDSFEELAKNLFERELVNNSFLSGMPLSDMDYKSIDGARKLYCASVSDLLGETDDAQMLYDTGMNLLDDYTKKHSLRNKELYTEPPTYLNSVISFHQSWMVNNSDQLKGMIFLKIQNTIEKKYYQIDPLGKKSKTEFSYTYKKHCFQ